MENSITTEYKWWDNLEKITLLKQAFSIGCSDKEACLHAGISQDQLYYYTREVNPEFQVEKERLKETPILKAKNTIVGVLDQPEHAKWYLERKKKDEFSIRTEQTGKDGEALIPKPIMDINVPKNNSDEKDNADVQENKGDTRGDISKQDNLDTPILDSIITN